MIKNDDELDATLERIRYFAKVQAGIRKTATPRQFESMSAGYLDEIKRMYEEALEFLSCQDGRSPKALPLEGHEEIQSVPDATDETAAI